MQQLFIYYLYLCGCLRTEDEVEELQYGPRGVGPRRKVAREEEEMNQNDSGAFQVGGRI